MIDIILRFAGGLQLALRYHQRMIAAFDNVQNVPCLHFCAHALEKIERTKRIARSLDKKNRRL